MSFKVTGSDGSERPEPRRSPAEMSAPLLDFGPKRPSIFERVPALPRAQELRCGRGAKDCVQQQRLQSGRGEWAARGTASTATRPPAARPHRPPAGRRPALARRARRGCLGCMLRGAGSCCARCVQAEDPRSAGSRCPPGAARGQTPLLSSARRSSARGKAAPGGGRRCPLKASALLSRAVLIELEVVNRALLLKRSLWGVAGWVRGKRRHSFTLRSRLQRQMCAWSR